MGASTKSLPTSPLSQNSILTADQLRGPMEPHCFSRPLSLRTARPLHRSIQGSKSGRDKTGRAVASPYLCGGDATQFRSSCLASVLGNSWAGVQHSDRALCLAHTGLRVPCPPLQKPTELTGILPENQSKWKKRCALLSLEKTGLKVGFSSCFSVSFFTYFEAKRLEIALCVRPNIGVFT